MTANLALALAFLPLPAWALLGIASGTVSRGKLLPSLVAGLLAGLAAVFCAVLAQLALGLVVPNTTLSPWLNVALPEEIARILAVGLAAGFGGPFAKGGDRRRVLWFGLLVGLSFFAFESLWFALRDPESLLVRLFWTMPLHGAAGVLVADRLASRYEPTFHPYRGLIAAVLLHGAWDYCREPDRLARGGTYDFLSLIFLLVTVFAAFLLWNIVPDGDE